jgi:tRNA pseudouridine38-40 synthase
MRVKAVISYDGSSFEGFQRQKRTQNTVTTAVENALKSLGITSQITGSGRTDAKVHATGQVVHFDLPEFWENQSLQKLKTHINRKLEAVEFKQIKEVHSTFHARFDAKSREYRYIFKTKKPNVFERNYISYLKVEDFQKLKEALDYLRGKHDFKMLSKKGSDTKTTFREIFKTGLHSKGDYHFINIQGDGFLRAQVRAMIFLVVAFANDKVSKEHILEQIDSKRRHTTDLVPPNGLYLAKVRY